MSGRHVLRSRGFRYLVVGAFNTGTSYAVYSSGLYLGLSVPGASLASILSGILLGFATQGLLVFRHLSVPVFFRFVGNWGIMYVVYVSVVLGASKIGVSPYMGGVIALIFTVPLSYFVLSRYVFRRSDSGTGIIASRQSN